MNSLLILVYTSTFRGLKHFSGTYGFFIPSILLSFGRVVVRWKWHWKWKVAIQLLPMCLLGFVSSNTPNPVSLAIFWKQVYTSSAMLLNRSKKPYCNFKSLEGKGLLVLFVFSRCLLEVVTGTADSLGRGEDNNQRICTKSAASSSCSGRCASLCSSDAIGGWWDVYSLLPISAHVWL